MRLYGVEIIEKPELGNRPSWVDNPESKVEPRKKLFYSSIKNEDEFVQQLSRIKEKFLSYNCNEKTELEIYDELKECRDEFLELLRIIPNVKGTDRLFLEELQNITNGFESSYGITISKKAIIHEIFIYTISFYFRRRLYKQLSYALNKTYFDKFDKPKGFSLFWCENERLNNEIKHRDGKNYHSGVAENWMNHINISVCSKSDFIVGDLLCANYAIFGNTSLNRLWWFPLSYCYTDGKFEKTFSRICTKEYLDEVKGIFGYEDIDKFVLKIKDVAKKEKSGHIGEFRVRFPAAYNGIALIYDNVNIDEIGKYR